jgi:hypothetical protein
VCFLDGNVFIPVLKGSPILSEAYLKQIAEETFLLQNLISNLSSKSIKQRIGECLLQIESIQSPINTEKQALK